MKAWRRGPGAGIGMVAALLLLAPGAAAKPGYEVFPGLLFAEVALPASNGFALSIEALGHRHVKLSVRRKGFLGTYAVKGRVSRKRIEADLGRFGKVSLRFEGRRVPSLDYGCRGRPPIREAGTYRGVVEFHGEAGFAEASVRHARGSVEQSFRQACPEFDRPGRRSTAAPRRRPAGDASLGIEFTGVSAVSPAAGPDLKFSTTRLGVAGLDLAMPWDISATLRETAGRVAVSKTVSVAASGSRRVLVSPPDVRPATAQVAPPEPFTGSASYDGSLPAGGNWTGTLSVRFPGVGPLALAGPGFVAGICRGESLDGVLGCLDP